MKNILDNQDSLPVEVALDFLVSYVENGIYNDERAKDKNRRHIALEELKICKDTIIKNTK